MSHGYTIRDWVASINDINSPAGNFAAVYNYFDNGNVSKAQYHNPQVPSGGGANTHSWAFSYDANGNLVSQSGKLSNVAYEHRNLPVQFALAAGDTIVAGYNADGQRILKELKGGSYSFYVMDGQQTLAVIGQNGLSHMNLVGNQTFGRIEASSGTIDTSNARRYYVSDHLGSTRAVVDNNGNVLDTFDYYPFGLTMPKRETDATGTLERFTGKERDDEGGLNLDYFGARYYDPAIGRWHSTDPLEEYASPYVYVGNNPVRWYDILGLMSSDTTYVVDPKKVEPVVVTANRPDFHNDYQGPNRFFHIGGRWGLWWYGMRNLGTKPHNVTIFQDRSSGNYYGAYTDWRYNTGVAPVPGSKLPSGLRSATTGLKELFKSGSIRGKPIITIRNTLTKNGFSKQGITRNKKGFIFRNAAGEEVRIMRRNGGWDIRVRNKHGNYLDEFGNVGKSPGDTHGINIISN